MLPTLDTVSTLTVTGHRSNDESVTEAFPINQHSFQTLSVGPGFTDLDSVRFDAHGWLNKAAYDNITVSDGYPVPEPATLALLGAAVLGTGAVRPRRAS